GDVTKGRIEFKGRRVDRLTPNELVKLGICQVMEGRHCFPHLTVDENLLTGAFTRSASRAEIRADLEKVYGYFPRLKQRRTSLAGYTSGGEQQMTAVGRALMAQPSMILLDEPSMGLAPQIVEEIFDIVRNLNVKENVSFLLAEQNTNVALRFADYGYILENGRVVMDGVAAAANRLRQGTYRSLRAHLRRARSGDGWHARSAGAIARHTQIAAPRVATGGTTLRWLCRRWVGCLRFARTARICLAGYHLRTG